MSTRKKRNKANHSSPIDSERKMPVSGALRSRASSDPLVIPGRTRFPSNGGPPPSQMDMKIADSLLKSSESGHQHLVDSGDAWLRAKPKRIRIKTPPKFDQTDGSNENPFEDPFDNRPTFLNASAGTFCNFSNTTSQPSSDRETHDFITIYNDLAKDSGLTPLSTFTEEETNRTEKQENASTSSPKTGSKNWFIRKMTRHSSSQDVKDNPKSIKRKNSVSSLLARRPRQALKCQSLEEMYRLGGVAILHLPAQYAATTLAIPTRLAATADYLVKNGRNMCGIFRVPGQSSVINALYDYYVVQYQSCEQSENRVVEATIGSATLPPGIVAHPHDIASAFKKFLWDLPGGILGSVTLFKALREINHFRKSHPKPSGPYVAKLISLAVLSLKSSRRITVICALFGLLAFLKEDNDSPEEVSPSRPVSAESMSSKAFGVVFAPILLGNLTDHVELNSSSEERPVSKQSHTPKKNKIPFKKSSQYQPLEDRSPEMTAGLEKATVCAGVVEMLIRLWEDVVRQMSLMEVPPKPQTPLGHLQPERIPNSDWWSASNVTLPSLTQTRVIPIREKLQGAQEKLSRLPFPPAPKINLERTFSESTSASHTVSTGDKKLHRDAENVFNSRQISKSSSEVLSTEEVQGRSRDSSAVHATTLTDGEEKQPGAHVIKLASGTGSAIGYGTTAEALLEDSQERHSRKTEDNGRRGSNKVTSVFDVSKNDSVGRVVIPITSHSSNDGSQRSRRSSARNVSGFLSRSSNAAMAGQLAAPPPFQHRIDCPSLPIEQQARTNVDKHTNHVAHSQSSNDLYVDTTKITPNAHNLELPRSAPIPEASNGTNSASASKKSSSMIPRPVNDRLRQIGPHPSPTPQHTTTLPRPPRNMTSSRARIPSRSMTQHQQSSAQNQAGSVEKYNNENRVMAHPSRSRWHQNQMYSDEPPVARRLNFRSTSHENVRARTTSSNYSEGSWRSSQRPKVGTLYAEIGNLRGQLESRADEITQLRQQVDAMRRVQDSTALSEKLREAEREMKLWKHRAQWAETSLFGRTWEEEFGAADGKDGKEAASQ